MQSATCTILRARRPCPASPLIPFEEVLMLLCVRPASQTGYQVCLSLEERHVFTHTCATCRTHAAVVHFKPNVFTLVHIASAAKIRYFRLSNFPFLSFLCDVLHLSAHNFGAQRANFANQRSSLNNFIPPRHVRCIGVIVSKLCRNRLNMWFGSMSVH
jgi:hypothetical protein